MLSAQPAPWPLAVPSTSDSRNDRGPPSPTSVQTWGSSSQPSVLGYTLHPKRVYDAKKNWGEGCRLYNNIKNANTRKYQELVNEFNYVMEDVVNEVLGDADPNDRVRFAILSSNLTVRWIQRINHGARSLGLLSLSSLVKCYRLINLLTLTMIWPCMFNVLTYPVVMVIQKEN